MVLDSNRHYTLIFGKFIRIFNYISGIYIKDFNDHTYPILGILIDSNFFISYDQFVVYSFSFDTFL
jgi:hypothetical protein